MSYGLKMGFSRGIVILAYLLFAIILWHKGLCQEYNHFLNILLTRQVFQSRERQYILLG